MISFSKKVWFKNSMLSVRESDLGSPEGKWVLDFGAGAGRHAYWAFSRGANVIAVDLSMDELCQAPAYFEALSQEQASSGIGVAIQASGLALPFDAESFDIVIASEVFEHIQYDQDALEEIARVVKPGGVLVVSVPRFFPELAYWKISSQYHNVPGGHIRIYRRSGLIKLLTQGGFQVYRTHHAHALHTPYWLIRCIVGVDNTKSRLYRFYHRFLVWDITKKPRVTAELERILNPVLGKSLVAYSIKSKGG